MNHESETGSHLLRKKKKKTSTIEPTNMQSWFMNPESAATFSRWVNSLTFQFFPRQPPLPFYHVQHWPRT